MDIRIGVYGKGPGKWSLRQAREEWSAIRTWSKENGKDLRERRREQKACESFLSDWTSANERGKREYRNLLWNQVLSEFGAKTPVEHFSWEYRHPGGKTTRELMTEYLGRVRKKAPSSASKQQIILKEVFGNAVNKGWIKDGQNPLMRSVFSPKDKKTHQVQHQPFPFWEQLSEFFEVFDCNEPNGQFSTRGACLLTFMTGLRVGAISGMRWEEVDVEEEEDLWKVPASRMKTWDDEEKNHLVSLTQPIKDLLWEMEKVNGGTEFVFASPRTQSKHINQPVIHQQPLHRPRIQGGLRWAWSSDLCSDLWAERTGIR